MAGAKKGHLKYLAVIPASDWKASSGGHDQRMGPLVPAPSLAPLSRAALSRYSGKAEREEPLLKRPLTRSAPT
jgi:hypothetical protein